MTREEAHKTLGEVAEAMGAQHAGQADRLHQMDSHLSTARMAIDHLFDASENAAAGGQV